MLPDYTFVAEVTRCGFFTLVTPFGGLDTAIKLILNWRTTMLGFLAAIGAGFATPYLEAPVARPIAKLMEKHITLEESEIRLIAFIVAMLAAGVVSALLDSGMTFWVILGGALGYFGSRLVGAGRAMMDARRDN
jgi:hypothetical protein